MADPRNELADIVIPLAPAVTTGGSSLMLGALIAGLLCVVCVALAAGLWRRGRSARSLRAISTAVTRQQDAVPALAARLDAWARARFHLIRLDAETCPPGLDPAAWFAWVNTLAQLRFAPVSSDGWDALADLCQTARQWASHA